MGAGQGVKSISINSPICSIVMSAFFTKRRRKKIIQIGCDAIVVEQAGESNLGIELEMRDARNLGTGRTSRIRLGLGVDAYR